MANKKSKSGRGKALLRVAVCIDTRDGNGRERLLGVYDYAIKQNWQLFLVRRDDNDALKQLLELPVDGAILFDRSARFHQALRAKGVTCVEASSRNLALDDAAVFVDDNAIGRPVIEHLVDVGFEHFAYCGPSAKQPASDLRALSFRQNATALGYSVATFDEMSSTGEPSLEPLTKWLRSLPKPTGVLAFDDKVAERVLAACRWAGISVPGEIGVVGIGDDELICEFVTPRLTSVSLPTREIGRRAAEILDGMVNYGRPGMQRPIPPTEVVIRESTERLPKLHPSVASAIAFIREAGHRPIGTAQIADAVKVPRRTLERRFVKDTGHTVHFVIVETRLRRAKRLLRRSGGALGDIARQCGYSALSAFTRMFTTHTGCHPAVYRQRSNPRF